MKELLEDIVRWRAAGKQVALARVVGTDGSGPRDPGAAMAVNEDSEVIGSVSGGCVEGAVLTEGLKVLERGLKVMDNTAISLCMDNKLPIVVFNLRTAGNLRRVIMGEPVGTTVKA